MAQHNELGKKAETLACDYLLNKGYAILERNFIYDHAEVDIIARKDKTVVCVEVKARSTAEFGNPQDFINTKKIKLLVKAMNEYVSSLEDDVEVRFDIIAILHVKNAFSIEHLEDAFYHF
ncbi:YraN family protein [Flavobacteriaceae bacterium M23B6Z8]